MATAVGIHGDDDGSDDDDDIIGSVFLCLSHDDTCSSQPTTAGRSS